MSDLDEVSRVSDNNRKIFKGTASSISPFLIAGFIIWIINELSLSLFAPIRQKLQWKAHKAQGSLPVFHFYAELWQGIRKIW